MVGCSLDIEYIYSVCLWMWFFFFLMLVDIRWSGIIVRLHGARCMWLILFCCDSFGPCFKRRYELITITIRCRCVVAQMTTYWVEYRLDEYYGLFFSWWFPTKCCYFLLNCCAMLLQPSLVNFIFLQCACKQKRIRSNINWHSFMLM